MQDITATFWTRINKINEALQAEGKHGGWLPVGRTIAEMDTHIQIKTEIVFPDIEEPNEDE